MSNNLNPNKKQSQSQKAHILTLLQCGAVLTPLDALAMVGTTKLATRVSELINKDGHTEIQKEWAEVTDRNGETIRVMSYRIEQPLQKSA